MIELHFYLLHTKKTYLTKMVLLYLRLQYHNQIHLHCSNQLIENVFLQLQSKYQKKKTFNSIFTLRINKKIMLCVMNVFKKMHLKGMIVLMKLIQTKLFSCHLTANKYVGKCSYVKRKKTK